LKSTFFVRTLYFLF